MRFVFLFLWIIHFSIKIIASDQNTIQVNIGSFDTSKNWSFVNAEESNLYNLKEWHLQKAGILHHITNEAYSMRPDKQTNFAIFRVQMILPKEQPVTLFDCSDDTVFASGGDKEFLKNLSDKIKLTGPDIKIKCAADYWHPYPDRTEDNDLRQNIAEIMEFKEGLKSEEKDSIAAAFKMRISGENYLEEVSLKRKVVSKLVDSCRSSLCWNIFDQKSNERAHQLRLIDKTQKTKEDWHLNDLFGKNFQLNFADSEQAIRQFICSLDHRKVQKVNVNDFLVFSPEFLKNVNTYKTETEYSKMKRENDKLKELADKIDQHLIGVITQSNVRFILEIASFNEMCRNCQATFQCELINMGIIQQKCMLLMIQSHNMDENLRWYINGRLYKYKLAQKIPPIVSLFVSSQSTYAITGEQL